MIYNEPLRCPACGTTIPLVMSAGLDCIACGAALEVTLQPRDVHQAEVVVRLHGYGHGKISTIKAVRMLTGLGLADAKNLVEAVMPVDVRAPMANLAAARMDLDAAGAQYEVIEDMPTARETAAAGPAARADAQAGAVALLDSGRNKIEVIKLIREVAGVGLHEAKSLCDRAPSRFAVLQGMTVAELQRRFSKAGATAQIEPA
jgi:large subunit ribosomal protein L7/L12